MLKEESPDKTSFTRLLERKDEKGSKEDDKEEGSVEYQAQDGICVVQLSAYPQANNW